MLRAAPLPPFRPPVKRQFGFDPAGEVCYRPPKHAGGGAMGAIYVTTFDMDRLRDLIESHQGARRVHLETIKVLERELDRAIVLEPEEVPADVVTMNSQVTVEDLATGEEAVYTLVFPSSADFEKKRVSILSPLGTALLGYRVGDEILWTVPAGERHWRIKAVLYQPEAAGDHQR